MQPEHIQARQRFEYREGEHIAYLSYQQHQGVRMIDHTIVPAALAGKGIGSLLAKAALDDSREQHLRVVPQCSFIAHYIDKHSEYRDLLAQ